MIPTLEQLGIDQLSSEQKIILANEILDRAAAERQASGLTEAQRAELKRRIADLEANPHDVIPWEEVYEQAMRRLRS